MPRSIIPLKNASTWLNIGKAISILTERAGCVMSPSTLRFGLLITYLRTEEKLILNRARARGLDVTSLLERQLVLDLNAPDAASGGFPYDIVVDRCVAHLPAAYTLKVFDRWGIPTINSAETTAVCDDKARCSLALEAGGVATPARRSRFRSKRHSRRARKSAIRRCSNR